MPHMRHLNLQVSGGLHFDLTGFAVSGGEEAGRTPCDLNLGTQLLSGMNEWARRCPLLTLLHRWESFCEGLLQGPISLLTTIGPDASAFVMSMPSRLCQGQGLPAHTHALPFILRMPTPE